MPRKQALPVRIRLYAEPKSSLYALVNVWPSRAAMYAYGKRAHITMSPDCLGTCSRRHIVSYRDGGSRRLPIFAEVNLFRPRLGMEVVTHELFHATIAWGDRVAFRWPVLSETGGVTPEEERLTYVHGRLCRQFVDRAYAVGLYQHDTTVKAAEG